MKRIFVVMAVIFAAFICSGCASIVNGTSQVVSVEAKRDQVTVVGAACTLANDKGVWFLTTPGTTTVHRSYKNLVVSCDKSGEKSGVAGVNSSVKGMAYGNILFGGLIGAGVDVASGAAFDYPSLITVQMGSNTVPPEPSAPVVPVTPAPQTASENQEIQRPVERPVAATPSPVAPPVPPAPVATEPVAAKVKSPDPVPAPAPVRIAAPPPINNTVNLQKVEFKLGESSYTVEKMARFVGCETEKGASLITTPGPVEVYRAQCRSGKVYLARCEFRQCTETSADQTVTE